MEAVKCNGGDLRTACLDTGLRAGIFRKNYGIEIVAKYANDGYVKLNVYEVWYHKDMFPSDPWLDPPLYKYKKERKETTEWNFELCTMFPQEIMSKRMDFAIKAADKYVKYAKGRKIDEKDLVSFKDELADSLERCITELASIDTL